MQDPKGACWHGAGCVGTLKCGRIAGLENHPRYLRDGARHARRASHLQPDCGGRRGHPNITIRDRGDRDLAQETKSVEAGSVVRSHVMVNSWQIYPFLGKRQMPQQKTPGPPLYSIGQTAYPQGGGQGRPLANLWWSSTVRAAATRLILLRSGLPITAGP